MKEEYWISTANKKIAVGDMTEAHVKNTLRMLIRQDRIKEFKPSKSKPQSYTDFAKEHDLPSSRRKPGDPHPWDTPLEKRKRKVYRKSKYSSDMGTHEGDYFY